jgi:uncharacterized iron-regulated membrane protein
MKRLVSFIYALLLSCFSYAQCSVCTKTAADMGDEVATGLNLGIVYLAFLPLTIIGTIGYIWWKRYRKEL